MNKKANKTATKGSTQRTDDDKAKLVEAICDHYEKHNQTIESVCDAFGITYRTFVIWCNDNSSFSDRYKKAKDFGTTARKDLLREKAVNGIELLIQGFHTTETETEEMFDKRGNLIGKRIKTKKRYIAPNPTAIIFALKNCDPKNWNDEINVELQGDEQVFKIGETIINFK